MQTTPKLEAGQGRRVALTAIVRHDPRNPELCVHAQSENDDRDLFCYLTDIPHPQRKVLITQA
jgi:hypothetical protein